LSTTAPYDLAAVRRDFPILEEADHGRPLIYLDNAASTQKPRRVIDAMAEFQRRSYANVHRGVYQLSERATAAYEGSRETVRRFLGASRVEEVVFTRGATEAINLVAATWGRRNLGAGDVILLTEMEHHANIVPWQLLAETTGAVVRAAPITDEGELRLDRFHEILGEGRVKLVSVAHVSNVLGTVNPLDEIIPAARAAGATVLVDGAQAVQHLSVEAASLGADFYVFSGHKVYGPTGIGVLWGRHDLLQEMPPYQGGGDMIRRVSFDGTTFADPPQRFEAGTPHITGAVGLAVALDYLTGLGLDSIAAHEDALLRHATERLSAIPGVRLVGTARHKASVVSFTVEGAHPHDVATILDGRGVAVRAGHHCAQPLMDRLGLTSTARAAFGLYNTRHEVDALGDAVEQVREIFG
jgi:cysteine desulfurase / selenocysteine lyase